MSDLTTTASETQPPTPTDTPTETDTETPTAVPAQFEVLSVDAPDSVQTGESHTITFRVMNTGEQTGTFIATVQGKAESSYNWQDLGTIRLEDVAGGETATYTSDERTIDQAATVQYRLVEYDIEFSYNVLQPQPQLTAEKHGFVEYDTGYSTERAAEYEISNTGDAATNTIEVTVDWYADGSYTESDTKYLYVIEPGETWVPRSPTIFTENPNAIDDFDVILGNAEPATRLNPEGLTISNQQLRASSQDVRLRGTVTNDGDRTRNYIEIVGKVYDASGNVVGASWTNESEFAPGDTYRFDFQPRTIGRGGEVEDARVVIKTSL